MISNDIKKEFSEDSHNGFVETTFPPDAKLLHPRGKGYLILEGVLKQILKRKQNSLWSDFGAHNDWDNWDR